MKRTLTAFERDRLPAVFHPLLEGAKVYDSSCSPMARVWFLDKDEGYYLKSAAKGTLQKEAELTRFFHQKGLGTEVFSYESGERDWLLTARVPGEDAIFPLYLDDPKRLCDTTAELLRMLHETDGVGCPVPNRTVDYLDTAARNHGAGIFDDKIFFEEWTYKTPEEAWRVVEEGGKCLRADTLLHGDYCLPNIMLDNWKFSGFIDLDNGGVGDRNVDLFWAAWSLKYNLKTDAYRERFLDAYGREAVNVELFPVIAAVEAFG